MFPQIRYCYLMFIETNLGGSNILVAQIFGIQVKKHPFSIRKRDEEI